MTSLDYFAKANLDTCRAAAPAAGCALLEKPKAQQKQWGGNLGGPIIKNKLHFFVNLERIDQNRARTININARPDLNFTATSRTTTSGTGWCASTIRSTRTTRGPFAGCAKRRRRPTSSCRPTTRCRRAEEEQDTDWTVVGTLNSVIANTRVNTLKISYTHEDVFFGNPGYFETGDQAALGPLLVHQTFEDGFATRANRRMDPAYQLDETFAWFLPGKTGDHDVKFGAS